MANGKNHEVRVALLEQKVHTNEGACKDRDNALSRDIEKGDKTLKDDINGLGSRIDTVKDSLNAFKLWLMVEVVVVLASILAFVGSWAWTKIFGGH